MIWTNKELVEALGVEIKIKAANRIQFNSNDVEEGDLFIALSGSTDGHAYAAIAINNGASGVVVSRIIENIAPDKMILVNDTNQALRDLAKYKRNKSNAIFIAITGSAGKTSTKEAIALMLQPFGETFKTRGNFNNELGVLINLASMSSTTKYAVLELGMNHSGEILELSKLVKPDIAIITNISNAHIEFFKSVDDIMEAKCEIFTSLSPHGQAIINYENKENYHKICEHIGKKYQVKKIYSFGQDIACNTCLKNYIKLGDKVSLKYKVESKEVEMEMLIVPIFQAENFAAGFQLLDILRLDLEKAAHSLSNFSLDKGRGQIITVYKEDKQYKIISDYYNASPAAMKGAIEYLATIEHDKKILIIGDMLELGENSKQIHASIVPIIFKTHIDKIILVGSKMKELFLMLEPYYITMHFDNVDQLIIHLPDILTNDEMILIKGAKRINLEKILTYFN